MQTEIATKSVTIDSELATDIDHIMENTDKMSDFMRLFWEQQKEASNKKSMMYHPMIIRFCLSLASKSASAYDELRSSKILRLPSRRTLTDYKNAIKPSPGFNPEVIQELCKVAEDLKDWQRFVCLSFDEMKVKENLVFDKHTEKLVGFVDLGDPDLNYSNFSEDVLAKYALVFYVRGIASDLIFSFAYFATDGVNARQIMSLFWEAVSYLELTCKLPVVACVSDGASPNRKFYKMHHADDNDEVQHKAINPFCKDRFVYFFADAPHLIKTMRNCMHHSGHSQHATRLMWNDGKEILWSHIFKLAQDELDRDIKLNPKLTMDHVQLNPFSKMNVKLATQVLSQTTANILFNYYPEGTHGTADFCQKMNKFFDCLNVRNQTEHVKQRKSDVAPYREEDDDRFEWLTNDFIDYLKKRKNSIDTREGNFSAKDKQKMFLSHQTYEGLLITAKSTVELSRFLLSSGMKFVLSEKFNQDVVEEYFMRQRSLGRRNENPDIYQFGYQANTIRMQRSVVPMTGNTSGKYKKDALLGKRLITLL